MAKELPHDIIENNILTRLPVRSLICVSKRWHFLILYTPKFAKSQRILASQHKPTHGILACCKHSVIISLPTLKSRDLGLPLFENLRPRKLSFPFEQNCSQHLLGSSNGLVFLALDDKFCVSNPSTRFFKKLPDIGCPRNESSSLLLSGAGYLFATDDYKVLAGYSTGKENGELGKLSMWSTFSQ